MGSHFKANMSRFFNRTNLVILLILGEIIFLIFSPALKMYFARDDFAYFPMQNYGWLEAWRTFIPNPYWFYRPLSNPFFFFVNYKFFGLNANGYHAVILLLHLSNSIILYAILRRLNLNKPAALLGSTFYAASRIHLMSVYWISGSSEAIGTLFYFSCFLGFVLYDRSGRIRWLMLSLVALTLGLLSREMLVTIPGVIGLYLIFYKPWTGFIKKIVELFVHIWPYLLIVGLYVFIYVQVIHLPTGSYARVYELIPTLKTLIKYTATIFITSADKNNLLSPLNTLIVFRVAIVVLGFLGLLMIFWKKKRRALLRPYLFGISWFYLTMLPFIFIPDHAYPYYLTIPSLGIALIYAQLFEDLINKQLAEVVGYAALTWLIILNTLIGALNHRASDYLQWVDLMQHGARMAAQSLSNISFEPGESVYITPSHLMSQSILFFGEHIRVHNLDKNLKVKFLEEADRDNFPTKFKVIRFHDDYTLTDVTPEYIEQK
jgi:hypothetical protein